MRKNCYFILICMICLFVIGCKDEISISNEVVFDWFKDEYAIINTENVNEIDSILFNNQQIDNSSFIFSDKKILLKESYLKELGYGKYDFVINVEDKRFDVIVYVTDSRSSKLTLNELYKYNNASIKIPIEIYDCIFELSYKGEKINDYKIENGELIINASFIELCGEEDIVLEYKFIYRSLDNPKEFLSDSGNINIQKILFGDIEW